MANNLKIDLRQLNTFMTIAERGASVEHLKLYS